MQEPLKDLVDETTVSTEDALHKGALHKESLLVSSVTGCASPWFDEQSKDLEPINSGNATY